MIPDCGVVVIHGRMGDVNVSQQMYNKWNIYVMKPDELVKLYLLYSILYIIFSISILQMSNLILIIDMNMTTFLKSSIL